ncbi:hypothetical protein ACVIHI_002662 [Bradyrhizobium sp. USDA 4524]|uniref:hypothetical protein n=1 Tax=unclassified Bradyrhizobium TaxID=2631580 RepID=UPI00209D7D14|nr:MULTISPECIES: hypothetical protein [unclassified Bradyrhizobium]MCP1844417.1 hypothetical protein [Bradyrhizobium sp. USDA 4538]MCP1904983.1 hypothetical protein [Bradyrhizobium sp. USDA 4537]MCP1989361.1 hypothetical protein [Bradyrhizobium sp. USDA 4539]
MVEITAESILQCSVSSLTTPPATSDISFIETKSSGIGATANNDCRIPECAAGDLILAFILHRDTLTPPAGFSLIATQSSAVTGLPTGVNILSAYSKVAVGGEAGTFSTWHQATAQTFQIVMTTFHKPSGSPTVNSYATAHVDNTTASQTATAVATGTADGQLGVVFATNARTLAFGNVTMQLVMAGATQVTPVSTPSNIMCGGYIPLNVGNSTTGIITSDGNPTSGNNGWSAITVVLDA